MLHAFYLFYCVFAANTDKKEMQKRVAKNNKEDALQHGNANKKQKVDAKKENAEEKNTKKEDVTQADVQKKNAKKENAKHNTEGDTKYKVKCKLTTNIIVRPNSINLFYKPAYKPESPYRDSAARSEYKHKTDCQNIANTHFDVDVDAGTSNSDKLQNTLVVEQSTNSQFCVITENQGLVIGSDKKCKKNGQIQRKYNNKTMHMSKVVMEPNTILVVIVADKNGIKHGSDILRTEMHQIETDKDVVVTRNENKRVLYASSSKIASMHDLYTQSNDMTILIDYLVRKIESYILAYEETRNRYKYSLQYFHILRILESSTTDSYSYFVRKR